MRRNEHDAFGRSNNAIPEKRNLKNVKVPAPEHYIVFSFAGSSAKNVLLVMKD